jgi:hypothetical protein
MPDVFARFILIWNDPGSRPFTDPFFDAARWTEQLETLRDRCAGNVTVSFFETGINSMNNRFAVWPYVQTRGVLIQDDDMWLEPEALRCLHKLWVANPTRLVGSAEERTDFWYHRSVSLEHTDYLGKPVRRGETGRDDVSLSEEALNKLNMTESQGMLLDWFEITPQDCHETPDGRTKCIYPAGEMFSMLLPHPWLLSRNYLRAYMEQDPLTWLVENMTNCDDIIMNAVVAHETGLPGIATQAEVYRHPTWAEGDAMWVSDPDWMQHRAQCMAHVELHYRDASSKKRKLPASPPSLDTHAVWQRSAEIQKACDATRHRDRRVFSSSL